MPKELSIWLLLPFSLDTSCFMHGSKIGEHWNELQFAFLGHVILDMLKNGNFVWGFLAVSC